MLEALEECFIGWLQPMRGMWREADWMYIILLHQLQKAQVKYMASVSIKE